MKKFINKSQLNLTIDIIMFVTLMVITGIGFLMKFILVPGYERNVIYGKNVELFFLGFDRHQWGNLHLKLSFVLLFLLLLHIILHWKQVVSVFKRMIPAKTLRLIFISIIIIVPTFFCILTLFVKPEIKQMTVLSSHDNGYRNRQIIAFSSKRSIDTISYNKSETETAILKENPNNQYKERKFKYRKTNSIKIYGYMTLNELEEKYNIPATKMAQYIQVPKNNTNKRLSQLKKSYSFRLNDLRNYIASRNNCLK